ncbi:hypothetical protein GGX14DRAFT_353459 [Mycena pura]|uniref:F-box domain-containing protein n=1 Tax=Mycena pura TaxID=153505 RepID=A0AAD6YH22_9AGAR|nr:hypothetical protein GGX14DRAFT_353459 [Mycena pura]
MTPYGSLILRGCSDVDRLPNEVLSAIFMFVVEPHSDDMTTTTSPTTISQVCHRWRQVALATGSLWTNIVLTFPTSREQLTRTITWLVRSNTYPLDILLDFRDPEWDFEDEESHGFCWTDMEPVLRLLLPSAARWRTIELFTDTWAPIFAFLGYTRTIGPSLSRLEKLHLARCNAYFALKGEVFEPAELSRHLPLFGGAGDSTLPHLREVALTGVHIDWSAPPLANLTKLEFKYQAADVMPSVAQFARIVAACPTLAVLAIVGCGPQFPRTAHGGGSASASTVAPGTPDGALNGAIQLTNVTQFTFGFVDVHYAVQLLAIMDLPALRELSLEHVSASLRDPAPDDAGVLLEWLCNRVHGRGHNDAVSTSPSSQTPLAQLSTLALHSFSAPRTTFVRLFAACSGVHALELSDVDEQCLKALVGTPALLPRLRTLDARDVDRALVELILCFRGAKVAHGNIENHSLGHNPQNDN